ncbi:Ribonuclease H domain [Arabidopsis suecica]|uniref:Ribonuclease H domain n=1 Tax=Arabidopsis suecica TaxID=45249 RepID=A0A8T1YNI5_ARASU|nr:Ribonuclease H domain [Arabidopsis suecica]
MADKDLWFALQNLNLGSDRSPIKLSTEATRKRDADHRLSLVVKGLHPSQNPAGIKVMMPKIWKLEGRVSSRINEDGTVQFFFKHEHQMLTVLDTGPWTYKDWLVVVDKWVHRRNPDYLRTIPFWIKLQNIPDDSKDNRVIEEIGGVLGHVTDVHIQQPTIDHAGEVWVRVQIDISARLIFARFFHLDDSGEPTLVRYIYDKLRKFCSSCGSLTHLAANCDFQIHEVEQLQLPAPSQTQAQDRNMEDEHQMDNRSHTPDEDADDTMGETVGSNINMDVSENQLHTDPLGDFMEFLQPAAREGRIGEALTIREIGSASAPFQNREGPTTFCLSYVYGNPERKPRQVMWQMMENMVRAGLYRSKPRVVLGDFNEIKSNVEKLGGPLRPEWQFRNFCRMLDASGLHEIKTYGGPFTWIGNRSSGTIKSKLDRAVATAEWKDQFPKALVQVLDWIGSDHKPLLLQTDNRKWKGVKLFRYDNRWRLNAEIHGALQNTWQQRCRQLPPQQFNEALKRCRHSLACWKTEHNTNSHRQIQQLQMALQKAYESPSPDYSYITNLKLKLQNEYRSEEEYWRTKSRIHWMQAGDKNTKYFHAKTKQRRSHNRITSIQDAAGNIVQTEKEIQATIHSYFTDLYSSVGSEHLETVLQNLQPRVTPTINSHLTAPVTEEEVFQAITHMNVDKSPGPDGLNAGFYKHHWDIIKTGVVNFVKCFFETGFLDPEINHTHICLVPKIESPTQVKDFRPISLCNIAYKIISKILAERLKPWLHHLISEAQSAFIPGRLITDNVVITHELLHSLRTKKIKTPYMALKLDIAKAFDKVEWGYIEAILKRFGFAEQWCQWVMRCVTSVSYSVLINGSPSQKIYPCRGLRQGDPLSPYLYLLCTEGLSSLLSHAMHTNDIHGFKASCNGPPISHMLFADDSLLFCKATEEECQHILHILQIYAAASGQHVNFQKSAILFGKTVNPELQQKIIKLTGISKIGGFGKYLGLPEAVGRNKTNAFSYIAQRVQQKLDNWYSHLLSLAGKEILIKSVATALPTYTMSCFLLPKRLIAQITGQMRRFWWSNQKEKQKIPWVAWSKMTSLKQYGGMGFKDLHHFNIALLAKQSWRMLKNPQSLLSRVLKAKYFSKTHLMEAKLGSRPSHAWRSIFQGMQLIKQGLKWRICDGNTVRVWHDQWLDNPPRPAKSLSIHNSTNLKVSDLMKPSTTIWDDNKLRELIHPEDIPIIQRIRPRVIRSPDEPTWIYTKNGQYSVKSGYHQLSKPDLEFPSQLPSNMDIWKAIWALNVPPKLKHFWWKIIHNALPVADNLAHRHIKITTNCLFCNEGTESIIHLLFQCRVAKEIWELSPICISPGQLERATSLLQIFQDLISSKGKSGFKDHLFPFIGWRIWKARNDLLYSNRRWAIPDIIHQALLDFSLWKNAQTESKRLHLDKNHAPALEQIVPPLKTSLYCYTDASWIDSSKNAGIGWALADGSGKYLLKGSSSIAPTTSALEAEAIALLEAVLQLRRLNYQNITFCGDSASLYRYLERVKTHSCPQSGVLEIQSYLDDITAMTKDCSGFQLIPRTANHVADALAKEARINASPYVISWSCLHAFDQVGGTWHRLEIDTRTRISVEATPVRESSPMCQQNTLDHSFKSAGSKQVGGRFETTRFLWVLHDDFSTTCCPNCLRTYLVQNLGDDMFDRRPHTDRISTHVIRGSSTRQSDTDHASSRTGRSRSIACTFSRPHSLFPYPNPKSVDQFSFFLDRYSLLN